eukprot:6950058-Ditylum_brightwellii.AAC.1
MVSSVGIAGAFSSSNSSASWGYRSLTLECWGVLYRRGLNADISLIALLVLGVGMEGKED